LNVLVTGATGFIGSHLVNKLLDAGHNVRCTIRNSSDMSTLPVNKQIEVVNVDLQAPQKDIFDSIQIVIHLAAQLGEYGIEPDYIYKINYDMTKKLLLQAEQSNVEQFIFCSTPGVLGFGHRLAPEDTAYNPRNLYEKTKTDAEQFIISHCADSHMKYTIIRPDFVYGPGDIRRIKLYKAIRNRKFILTTSGKSYIHPTYIDDVIQGFLLCVGNPKSYNEVFNIAAAEDVQSSEFLQVIANEVGSRVVHINIGYKPSIFISRIVDIIFDKIFHKEGFVTPNKIDFLATDHSSSIEKAKRILGYSPEFDIYKGLHTTINWCRHNDYL
jgi:UDP-glucose 4-epimerase